MGYQYLVTWHNIVNVFPHRPHCAIPGSDARFLAVVIGYDETTGSFSFSMLDIVNKYVIRQWNYTETRFQFIQMLAHAGFLPQMSWGLQVVLLI
jgi:hypothetical protein